MEKSSEMASSVLYERLATDLRDRIERGVFAASDRLPSIRETRQATGLSAATVLHAYRLLEDQGLIEARPQSGYYVLAPLYSDLLAISPETSMPPLNPETVRMDELMGMVIRQAARADMVQFGAATPAAELLPTRRLKRMMTRLVRENDALWSTYVTPEGSLELRGQVARRLARLSCPVTAEDLLITSGCQEAIHLALRAVCRPGDVVAVESPTYFGMLQALEAEGLRALEIPTHHRDGISLEALEQALQHQPVRAVVVIPNFQNPLGSCMPEDRKAALVDLLARYETPLIEDDINGELAFSDRRPGLAKAYDRQGLVLTCSSFSKDIGPSFRVGWVAPGRYYARVLQLKMTTNIGTALLPQLVIAEFLENGGYDNYLRGLRRAYQHKVGQMARSVLEYFPAGTRVTTPRGGFVLWVQLPANVDSLDLFKRALPAGVTLAPGYLFSATAKYCNFIRLNAAHMDFAAERTIRQLGKLASQSQ